MELFLSIIDLPLSILISMVYLIFNVINGIPMNYTQCYIINVKPTVQDPSTGIYSQMKSLKKDERRFEILDNLTKCNPLKWGFHRTTNHADERHKTADEWNFDKIFGRCH